MRHVIRHARPEELDEVGRMTVAAYLADEVLAPDAPYLAVLGDARARARDAEVWVADGVHGLLGTVTFVLPPSPMVEVAAADEAEIRCLAVSPDARGGGVGAALTRHALALAGAAGCRALVLSSSTRMHAAHRLYARLGFIRLPERDWSPVPGVDLVAYTHPL